MVQSLVHPTATCVDNSSPLENTGAQMTVENLESMTTCRLTTTSSPSYYLGCYPRRLRKKSFLRPQFPSAAEAATDFAALTARLEAAPLQSKH
jgi:hypothetical protein